MRSLILMLLVAPGVVAAVVGKVPVTPGAEVVIEVTISAPAFVDWCDQDTLIGCGDGWINRRD